MPGGRVERYSLVLSDGLHTMEIKLITPLRHLVRDGCVRRASVVRFLWYCSIFESNRLTKHTATGHHAISRSIYWTPSDGSPFRCIQWFGYCGLISESCVLSTCLVVINIVGFKISQT
ncbi:uncharacterized protein LOC119326542 isoform X1 [Triticum dicoccoides]|uniref:uncharacterized protein LOC119326542 isoform X1 n=1 Tax=Triticum dicoccoides TaxID=85692 RepID=UPI001890C9BE|nr:uncharacterized protein LOC119326542 isoform X1 [Triticum dicoccoides]